MRRLLARASAIFQLLIKSAALTSGPDSAAASRKRSSS
jgi:hypothetical protein